MELLLRILLVLFLLSCCVALVTFALGDIAYQFGYLAVIFLLSVPYLAAAPCILSLIALILCEFLVLVLNSAGITNYGARLIRKMSNLLQAPKFMGRLSLHIHAIIMAAFFVICGLCYGFVR